MKALVSLVGLLVLAIGCSTSVVTDPVTTAAPALIVVSKDLRPETASRLAAVCIQYRVDDRTEETCVPIILGDISNDRATECYGSAIVGRPLPESCR